MSKADQLGAGRFGGGVRSISARRQAVAAATGVPTDGAAPPTELPPHRISLNPDNPRSTLGDLTDLASLVHVYPTYSTEVGRLAAERAYAAAERHRWAVRVTKITDRLRRR